MKDCLKVAKQGRIGFRGENGKVMLQALWKCLRKCVRHYRGEINGNWESPVAPVHKEFEGSIVRKIGGCDDGS